MMIRQTKKHKWRLVDFAVDILFYGNKIHIEILQQYNKMFLRNFNLAYIYNNNNINITIQKHFMRYDNKNNT